MCGVKSAMHNNFDLYFTQWLKTATNGNVSCENAWLTDRFKFVCKVCGATAKMARPKNFTEVPYDIQCFVDLHAHKPGHVKPGQVIEAKPAPYKLLEPKKDEWQEEWEQQIINQKIKAYQAQMELDKLDLDGKLAKIQAEAQAKKIAQEYQQAQAQQNAAKSLGDWAAQANTYSGLVAKSPYSFGQAVKIPASPPPAPEPPKEPPKEQPPLKPKKTGRRFR